MLGRGARAKGRAKPLGAAESLPHRTAREDVQRRKIIGPSRGHTRALCRWRISTDVARPEEVAVHVECRGRSSTDVVRRRARVSAPFEVLGCIGNHVLGGRERDRGLAARNCTLARFFTPRRGVVRKASARRRGGLVACSQAHSLRSRSCQGAVPLAHLDRRRASGGSSRAPGMQRAEPQSLGMVPERRAKPLGAAESLPHRTGHGDVHRRLGPSRGLVPQSQRRGVEAKGAGGATLGCLVGAAEELVNSVITL